MQIDLQSLIPCKNSYSNKRSTLTPWTFMKTHQQNKLD